MGAFSARGSFLSLAAIGGAVLWGLAELLALLWARYVGRSRVVNTF